jgi:uncharacterized ferritin-like protein (DUF455 family)
MTPLAAAALGCLLERDVAAKLARTADTAAAWRGGRLALDGEDLPPVVDLPVPGRPERPVLVAPRDLAPRGLGTPEGRVALLHAVAHIEFNAINLAWDAVYRFRGLPRAFYDDWVAVADDEARHFGLLAARLAEHGAAYGDLPAHNGLWEMALRTAADPLARMALVPRVLEARGLDVTPGMIARLRAAGDRASADVLEIILREEVAHVAAGSRWFEHLCGQRRLDPASTFIDLVRRHAGGAVRPPFNAPARAAAGFGADELAALADLNPGPAPPPGEGATAMRAG